MRYAASGQYPRCLHPGHRLDRFYILPPSPRFIVENERQTIAEAVNLKVQRVGVFVNETTEIIQQTANQCRLTMVQLHGQEQPKQCNALRNSGLQVIKAFSVSEQFDFSLTENYRQVADYFLFDTKTPKMGGSGEKFDWKILANYKGSTPFLISGGIAPDDSEAIRTLKHPALAGVDLNSRFETQPGCKNSEQLNAFIQSIR